MNNRGVRSACCTLLLVAAFLAGIVVGWWPRARTVRISERQPALLSIRSTDVVADQVNVGGLVLATVTVCNSTSAPVVALESVAFVGGPTPLTVYAGVPRRVLPGCVGVALRIVADVEPRAYRLLFGESMVWAESPRFEVLP